MLKRYLPKLYDRLFAQVDLASVALFRIGFGAIMMWEVYRYFQYGRVWNYYMFPKMYFTYGGFEWIQPWKGLT